MRMFMVALAIVATFSFGVAGCKRHHHNPQGNRFLVNPVQEGECVRVEVKVPEGYTGYLTLNGDIEAAVFTFLSQDEVISYQSVDVEDVLLCGVNLDALNTLHLELRYNEEVVPEYGTPFGESVVETVEVFVEDLPEPPPPPAPEIVVEGQKITIMGINCDVVISENGAIVATLIRDGFVVLDLPVGQHSLLIEDCSGFLMNVVIVVEEEGPDPCLPDLASLPTGGSSTIRSTRLQDTIDSLHLGGKARLDVDTDYISDSMDSYWAINTPDGIGPVEGTAAALIVIELAGFAPKNRFGVFDPTDPTRQVQLFKGSQGTSASVSFVILPEGNVFVNDVDTGIVFSSQRFGFWLDSSMYSGGGFFYSDTSLNSDGNDHMLVYQGDNDVIINPPGDWPAEVFRSDEFILAFEDLIDLSLPKVGCYIPQSDWDFEDMVILVSGIRPRLCD